MWVMVVVVDVGRGSGDEQMVVAREVGAEHRTPRSERQLLQVFRLVV
jgi:hypothetical protein